MSLSSVHVRGVMPLLVVDEPGGLAELIDAFVDHGVSAVEVALRTPASLAALDEIAADGRVAAVAGSVLTIEQARDAVRVGAVAAVAPGFDAAVSSECHTLGVQYIPGVATATEVLNAKAAGWARVKFFPAASSGGISTIRAWGEVIPGVLYLPSGGVGNANVEEYLSADEVFAVSGSWLTPRRALATRDFATIRQRLSTALNRTGSA